MRHILPAAVLIAALTTGATAQRRPQGFHLHEATVADIQQALLKKELTTVRLVELYLARIKAYNGTCVNEPQGILGPVTTIAGAGQINALSTLNLRPAARAKWGFDDRKARSMTDSADDDSAMPDALETAAAQDAGQDVVVGAVDGGGGGDRVAQPVRPTGDDPAGVDGGDAGAR